MRSSLPCYSATVAGIRRRPARRPRCPKHLLHSLCTGKSPDLAPQTSRTDHPRPTIGAESSTASCSPPERTGYEPPHNHLEMAGRRADWNDRLTKIFLDLCIAEKEKLNWVGKRGLTKHGWKNLYSNFQQRTGNNYDRKQLQNKYNSLKRHYNLWRKLKSASGGGWDSTTGTITMDDEWWRRQIEEDASAEQLQNRPLQFQDELERLFGTTDMEEGDMLCVGGIGDQTPSNGSDNNTPVSDDNIERSCVRLSDQRSTREQIVDSPPAKRKKSVEYYVERLSESMLERSMNQSTAKSREQEEIAALLRKVQDDGVPQTSELYYIATDLFRSPSRRIAYKSFDSAEGSIGWLKWT